MESLITKLENEKIKERRFEIANRILELKENELTDEINNLLLD